MTKSLGVTQTIWSNQLKRQQTSLQSGSISSDMSHGLVILSLLEVSSLAEGEGFHLLRHV